MEERYIAVFIIHAIGDTIGYNNRLYEFNFNKPVRNLNDVHELFYDFLHQGGINHFSLKDRNVSDDTLMHIAVGKSLKQDQNQKTLYKKMAENFIKTYNKYFENEDLRSPGITIMKNIKKIKDGRDYDKTPYLFSDGGSGASMRNACLGLIFDDIDELLEVSIFSSKITHNSATGYLGGFVSAYFTYLAINDIHINEWGFKLLEILESDRILNLFKKKGTHEDIENYKKDSIYFISKWKLYMNDKFKDKKPVQRKSFTNLVFRSKYYNENITTSIHNNLNEIQFIGSAGDDSTIISYDCLLDSQDNWEKLVIYAMLHVGDTDTTGCISGAWYGAYYGFKNIPKHYRNEVEFKTELETLGKDLYKLKFKK